MAHCNRCGEVFGKNKEGKQITSGKHLCDWVPATHKNSEGKVVMTIRGRGPQQRLVPGIVLRRRELHELLMQREVQNAVGTGNVSGGEARGGDSDPSSQAEPGVSIVGSSGS